LTSNKSPARQNQEKLRSLLGRRKNSGLRRGEAGSHPRFTICAAASPHAQDPIIFQYSPQIARFAMKRGEVAPSSRISQQQESDADSWESRREHLVSREGAQGLEL